MNEEKSGFKITIVCKDCTSTSVSLTVNQWYEITMECQKCGQTERMN